jgi:hypothetical protein
MLMTCCPRLGSIFFQAEITNSSEARHSISCYPGSAHRSLESAIHHRRQFLQLDSLISILVTLVFAISFDLVR